MASAIARLLYILWRTSATTGVLVLGGITFLAVALYFFQGKLIFHPRSPAGMEIPETNCEGCRSPSEYGIKFEDVRVKTPDGEVLAGWFMPQTSPDLMKTAPTFLFLQGNAGNMGLRLPNLSQMYKRLHVNILAVGYRGYGHSTGTPSEKGLWIDGKSMLDYLVNEKGHEIDVEKVFIFGRSLGGAVAIHLLSTEDYKFAGMIVENTFTSIMDMAVIVFPFLFNLKWLIQTLCTFDMDSLSKVKKTSEIPQLYISSDTDALVPRWMMKKLYYSCAATRKGLITVRGGGHTDAWAVGGIEYFHQISNFVADSIADKWNAPKYEISVGVTKKESSGSEPNTPPHVPYSSHKTLTAVALAHLQDTELNPSSKS